MSYGLVVWPGDSERSACHAFRRLSFPTYTAIHGFPAWWTFNTYFPSSSLTQCFEIGVCNSLVFNFFFQTSAASMKLIQFCSDLSLSLWRLRIKASLRGLDLCMRAQSLQSWLTLGNPMDGSLPGSSIQCISQARILERVAISFSKGSSPPWDWTRVSCIAGRFFTTESTGKPPTSFNGALLNQTWFY